MAHICMAFKNQSEQKFRFLHTSSWDPNYRLCSGMHCSCLSFT